MMKTACRFSLILHTCLILRVLCLCLYSIHSWLKNVPQPVLFWAWYAAQTYLLLWHRAHSLHHCYKVQSLKNIYYLSILYPAAKNINFACLLHNPWSCLLLCTHHTLFSCQSPFITWHSTLLPCPHPLVTVPTNPAWKMQHSPVTKLIISMHKLQHSARCSFSYSVHFDIKPDAEYCFLAHLGTWYL